MRYTLCGKDARTTRVLLLISVLHKRITAVSKCYHPHIVQVYDIFPEDGLWAIAMEHIDGDDLAAYVENYTDENGYLSETEALRYIDQIGQALECVHERKLLHQNVKFIIQAERNVHS